MNKRTSLLIIILLIYSHVSAGLKDSEDRNYGTDQTDIVRKDLNLETKIVKSDQSQICRSLLNQFNNNQESATRIERFGWVVKQGALAYGTSMAIVTGRELGHLVLPWMCGAEASIKVNFNLTALCEYGLPVLPPNISRIFIPLTVGMGPIMGMITSLGILKATNIYDEYKKSIDMYTAFKNGIHKPLINKDQPIGIKAAALNALITLPFQYLKGSNFFSDGHLITNSLNLHGIKASIVRGSMATAALGIGVYMISKDYDI